MCLEFICVVVKQLDRLVVEKVERVGRLRDVNGGASLSELSARTDGFPLPVAKLELLIQQEILSYFKSKLIP